MQPFSLFALLLSTDDPLSSNTSLTRDTLRDLLALRLQWYHRRVPPLERTTPLHHSAHHCTCRWRMTSPPFSRCIPDDRWDGDAHNPADPDRGTCPYSAGHTGNG